MKGEDFPLRGPAVYNPHLLGREELSGLFVARHALLEELLDDLRRTPSAGVPQHQLLIGARGMGKTMLLRRLQLAIEEDPALARVWLPLGFPEEQYNVASLADFWANCLDALSDAFEARCQEERVADLDRSVEALRGLLPGERAKEALRLLGAAAKRQKRRLVLLVDNADLIFDRIGEEEWALREALSAPGGFAFVGASSTAAESTYNYGKAFFDFFKVHELAGLNLEETEAFLKGYSSFAGDGVAQVVEEDPGRVKTLHNLTGGNPRTLVLLYNVLVAGGDGDVRSDLERLLDHCTPLYKARFEEMPAQAQKIVHALALRWDPVTAADLALDTGLDINTVSGQINRLARQAVVQKVPYDPESKTGFQVAERFFNIWYLMRASRRVRRRLIWLVEFLKVFYGQEELEQRAVAHLRAEGAGDRERHAALGFTLAEACGSGAIRGALEMASLKTLLEGSEANPSLRELFELEIVDDRLRDRGQYLKNLQKLEQEVRDLEPRWGIPVDEWRQLLLGVPLPLEWRERQVELLRLESSEQTKGLLKHLQSVLGVYRCLTCLPSQTSLLFDACRAGYISSYRDFGGALQWTLARGDRALLPLMAGINLVMTRDDREAAKVLADSESESASPLPLLVALERQGAKPGDKPFQQMMTRIRKMEGLDPDALIRLAYLSDGHGRRSLAELAAHAALNLDRGNWPAAWSLATFSDNPRLEEFGKIAAGSPELRGSGFYAVYDIQAFPIRAQLEFNFLETAAVDARAQLEKLEKLAGAEWVQAILGFFGGFAARGQEAAAARILDELGLAESWRPLREALEVRIKGSRSYLKRLSPEVRRPTVELLDILEADVARRLAWRTAAAHDDPAAPARIGKAEQKRRAPRKSASGEVEKAD